MTDYYHWRKFDGSFDSICPVCVIIIAHADDEEELVEKEKNHICASSPPSEYAKA